MALTNNPQTIMQKSLVLPFKRCLALTFSLMVLLLVLDPVQLDFHVARLLYVPGQGFIGEHNVFLETVLHRQAKYIVMAFFVLTIICFFASWKVVRLRPWRRQLGYIALAMGVSTAIIPPLKALTEIQCPKDLVVFGGGEAFVPLLGPLPGITRSGRCWPGGHAATGFSLLALYFALRERHPRLARVSMVFALAFGGVLSLGRMLQGAHFLSHNLWTLLIDWTICLVLSRVFLDRYQAIGTEATSYGSLTRLDYSSGKR